MSTIIEAEQGVVLVELGASEYGDMPVPEKSHDSMTWGIVMGISDVDSDKEYLIGRTVFWRKFKDDARVPALMSPNKRLVFIEIKDILGSAYEPTSGNN